MDSIYMVVSITDYNSKTLGPDCTFWQGINQEPLTRQELSIDKARKLMWELVLAGAEKVVEVNPFNPLISTRRVSYWARR